MTYSAIAVANAVLHQAGGRRLSVTPARLQSLLYLANIAHLKAGQGPVLDDTFVHHGEGPVIPSLWHKLRALDGLALDETRIGTLSRDPGARMLPRVPPSDQSTHALISALLDRFGTYSEATLLLALVKADSAWAHTPNGSPILTSAMLADADRLFPGFACAHPTAVA